LSALTLLREQIAANRRAYGSLTPLALLVASVVFGTWVGIVLIP
jgi:hypothetical protein